VVLFASDYDGTIRRDGQVTKEDLAQISAFQAKGNIFGIVTGRAIDMIAGELKHYGIAFDFIIGGNCVEKTKPHPEIFLKACDALNVDVGDALVLEDSPNGITAAYNAGIKCIMIPDLAPPDETLSSMVYKVINNLSEAVPVIEALRA